VAASRYQDLRAWQRAIELAERVYAVTSTLPQSEMHGLKSQMRRCAVSVSSNIAEGQGRSTRGEFHQFLGHARGSLYELETQTGNCGKTWLHRTVRSGLFVRRIKGTGPHAQRADRIAEASGCSAKLTTDN
jgi:four helix bundle protein